MERPASKCPHLLSCRFESSMSPHSIAPLGLAQSILVR